MGSFSLVKLWQDGAVETAAYDGGAKEEMSDGEGSFFDIEFALPDYDCKCRNEGKHIGDCETDSNDLKNEKRDYEMATKNDVKVAESTLSSFSSSSKDFFFKSRVLPLEPNLKPQSPISLLRSPPKLGVFMLGLKRSKARSDSSSSSVSSSVSSTPNHRKSTHRSKFFIKFKLEEAPLTSSMSTRDNSKRQFQAVEDESKRFTNAKNVVRKYLKLIKPLYVMISKRYSEKVRFSDQTSSSPTSSPNQPTKTTRINAEDRTANFPAGLRVACRHLGKSRSASSTAGVTPPMNFLGRGQEEHDGIQGAILHCKQSFNSSSDLESSILSRRTSETSTACRVNSS
ncbi:hypothetical protein RJ641_007610 [Dillenia turbinata]|uniref:Membrane-associated kinase regulator 2 n=1 Tax=Dillenia turbinata TaxID=194707 RepID=A0AAN8Z5R4_9MAGN